MSKLVLLRHGESTWNRENRFTGWSDVGLSPRGIHEAREAGKILKTGGYRFDRAFTSVLKRAIHTLWIVADEMNQAWMPVEKAWELNERHYGALQGMNKDKAVAEYGEEQVHLWRRGYSQHPPALAANEPTHPRNDPRYAHIGEALLPDTESLEDTLRRVIPYWERRIMPQLESSRACLVVAHGNSLRALIKQLDGISDADISQLEIPTGIPLVYEFDSAMRPISRHYLHPAATSQNAA